MTNPDNSKPPQAKRIGLRPSAIGFPPGTERPILTEEYKSSVCQALATPQDVWGQQVIDRPEGPTYDNMKDYFTPIMYAINGADNGSFMTDTGVYYIPFGQPKPPTGLGDVALTVADGSQIISNRTGGISTRIYVGANGKELFGSCLANLGTPELYKEYLPILELNYRDYEGVQYHQESLATYLPGTDILASFVEITADPGQSGLQSTTIRIQVCDNNNLRQDGNQLFDDQGRSYIYFSPGCTFYNTDLTYKFNFDNEGPHTVYLVRLVTPAQNTPKLNADQEGQQRARAESTAYWENRLAEGNLFHVPENLVMDAQRNLLIQDLLMTWRYSLGNAYQAFYQPESNSTVAILGRYGFTDIYRQSLKDLLPMSKGANRRSWEFGEKLTHAADYYRLTGDASLILENMETHIAFADDLATQHANDPNHLLERQQYSSDVKSSVYGLHQIGTAVYGLQSIVSVWKELGEDKLADKYGPIAENFRKYYDEAVAKSSTILPDGSLFTSVSLLDKEEPYTHLAATYLGSYWNLVAHYAYAAHLYAPGSPEAQATLQYLYNHGSRLLGQIKVRDGAINDVYAVKHAKFLADNDQPDQLILSFYGHLAHAMTRNTFISGESANVGPLASKWPLQFGACEIGAPCTPPSFEEGWAPDEYYRGIYLSPNSANNAFSLQILRLMLINEVTNHKGEPQILQLGFATPRAWLEQGKRIQVYDAPTLFGPVTYTMISNIEQDEVLVDLEVPSRTKIGSIQLRLRVPAGKQLTNVIVNGHPHAKLDLDTETIDLTGMKGKMKIRASFK